MNGVALIKRIAAILFLLGVCVALTLIYLWEEVGGAYPNWYESPNHSEYRAVIYDYAGVLAGTTAFALYAAEANQQRFLGFLGMEDQPEGTSWNINLYWTSDGSVIYSKDSDYRIAYGFEEKGLLIRTGLAKPPGSKRPVKFVDPTAFALFIQKHGGEGPSFFNEFQETNWIWRDSVPSENN
jgi:hypothetical protein